ncbi:MAG: ribosome hibernation-promoting factor, HPF/YfiA family [bacterium]
MIALQITVTGRHIEVTDALRKYAEDKIGRIAKYFDGIIEAHIILDAGRGRHMAEVTVLANGTRVHCEDETRDMYASIDGALDKLERQIKKYKNRLFRASSRSTMRKMEMREDVIAPESVEVEGATPRIVKTRRFAIKPMGLDEAVMQLDLSGDSFLVFSNSETGDINVLYKRKDGNYGLIEPEY